MRQDRTQGRPPVDRDAVPTEGTILAKVSRFSPGHPPSQLRVSLESFSGHPFVRVSVWEKLPYGFMPAKGRQASIRRGELSEVIDALCKARDMIEGEAEHDEPEPPPRSRGRREPSRPTTPGPIDPGFSEFD